MKATPAIIAAALFLNLLSAIAQEPSPTPESESPASSERAWLRTWVMLPPEVPARVVGEDPTLKDNLSLVYDDNGEPQTIRGSLGPFSTSGYTDFQPATREIRLVRDQAGIQVELAKAKAIMKPGSFLTAVVQKANGTYHLTLIDDTPKPPKADEAKPGEPPPPPPKQIFLYDFLPGHSAQISSKTANFSKVVAYGAPQLVTGLPGRIFNVQVPLKSKNREYLGDIEVDLQANDSLSILVVQDIYGRTTGRVLINGKAE